MLSVFTLNTWNYEGPWEQRLALIRRWLQLLDPDLVAMQEILLGADFDQAEAILAGFDYHRDYAPMMDFWLDPELKVGNLVASRWPIVDREIVELPQEGLADRRVLLATTIDSPHGPISFNTTHLNPQPHRGYLREKQVLAVAETVIRRRPRGGYPLIVCGDFNAQPESSEIRFLKGLHALEGRSCYLYDAWETAGDGSPGLTFSRRNNHLARAPLADLRIDYIFVGERQRDGSGRIAHCQVVCDVPSRGVFPSDHFGLYAELTTPGE